MYPKTASYYTRGCRVALIWITLRVRRVRKGNKKIVLEEKSHKKAAAKYQHQSFFAGAGTGLQGCKVIRAHTKKQQQSTNTSHSFLMFPLVCRLARDNSRSHKKAAAKY
jgi:hypothetical protein